MKHILSKPNHRRCKIRPTFLRFSKIHHAKQNGLRITINSNLHSRVTLKLKKKMREKKEKNRSRGHGKILALITNHDFNKNVNVDSRENKSRSHLTRTYKVYFFHSEILWRVCVGFYLTKFLTCCNQWQRSACS